MRVLVACEFSGVVRESFRKKGHEAAIRCLQGLLANGNKADTPRDLAHRAVVYADALTVAYGDVEPQGFYEPK